MEENQQKGYESEVTELDCLPDQSGNKPDMLNSFMNFADADVSESGENLNSSKTSGVSGCIDGNEKAVTEKPGYASLENLGVIKSGHPSHDGDSHSGASFSSEQSKKVQKNTSSENHERMTYLVQVSKAVATADPSLSSQTGSLAMAIGRKCLVRMDVLLKRSLCKGCGSVLVPGVNASCRHRNNRQKHLVITCLICKTLKRFVSSSKHKLWSQQPESLA